MNYPSKNSINNVVNDLDVQNSTSAQVIVRDWFQILKIMLNRDISEHTKKAIKADIKHFMKWFADENGVDFAFSKITSRDVIDYKRFCIETAKYATQTTNRRLNTLRAFLGLAFKEGVIKKEIHTEIKLLPLQPLSPKGLQKKELRALLREVELRGNLRDMLIVEMMCGAGLRVSEVVNLEVDDVIISDRKGFANVRNSKGGKTRKVPLNTRIRTLFEEYTNSNRKGKLFMGQRGPLTTIAINKMVDNYAGKIGLKCSPHSLRHSFAYNYLSQNISDIVGLSQILGHNNLNTTAIYTQNRLEDLQERVERM